MLVMCGVVIVIFGGLLMLLAFVIVFLSFSVGARRFLCDSEIAFAACIRHGVRLMSIDMPMQTPLRAESLSGRGSADIAELLRSMPGSGDLSQSFAELTCADLIGNEISLEIFATKLANFSNYSSFMISQVYSKSLGSGLGITLNVSGFFVLWARAFCLSLSSQYHLDRFAHRRFPTPSILMSWSKAFAVSVTPR